MLPGLAVGRSGRHTSAATVVCVFVRDRGRKVSPNAAPPSSARLLDARPPRLVAPALPTFHSAHPGNCNGGYVRPPPQHHAGVREAPSDPTGHEHHLGIRDFKRYAVLGGPRPARVGLPSCLGPAAPPGPAVNPQRVGGDEQPRARAVEHRGAPRYREGRADLHTSPVDTYSHEPPPKP